MPLNPFASAFVPGTSQKPAAVDAFQASRVSEVSNSQPDSLSAASATTACTLLHTEALLPPVNTPFAATQAASTNSSADEALQLEFEDLFQRGQVSAASIQHEMVWTQSSYIFIFQECIEVFMYASSTACTFTDSHHGQQSAAA